MHESDRSIQLAMEYVDRQLGLDAMPAHLRYWRTGAISETTRTFAERVLARHAADHRARFDAMHRRLMMRMGQPAHGGGAEVANAQMRTSGIQHTMDLHG